MDKDGIFEYYRDTYDFITLSQPNSKNNIHSHFHESIEVLYVTQGNIIVQLNNDTKILSQDQMVICDTFDVHSFNTPTPQDLAISFIIPPSLLAEYKAIKKSCVLRSNFICDKEVTHSFKLILDTLAHFYTPTKMNPVAANFAKAFLSLMATSIGFQENQRQSITLSSHVLQYISDNLLDDLTLEKVSSHFGYTKYYFSKLFYATFHTTFTHYVNILRAQKAIQLMKSGFTSLEAAFQAGFNSESTFYRFFHKEFNITPKQLITVFSN